jgi:hypothetical protein
MREVFRDHAWFLRTSTLLNRLRPDVIMAIQLAQRGWLFASMDERISRASA